MDSRPYFEDGGRTFLRNTSTHLVNYTVSSISTLKMKAASSSKMLASIFRTTRCCNPEDRPSSHHCLTIYVSLMFLLRIRYFLARAKCSLDFKGFWRWCTTFKTTGFLDFVHGPPGLGGITGPPCSWGI
jgi:hypothetical protein